MFLAVGIQALASLRDLGMWHLVIWFRGGYGVAGSAVGLDDLEGLLMIL